MTPTFPSCRCDASQPLSTARRDQRTHRIAEDVQKDSLHVHAALAVSSMPAMPSVSALIVRTVAPELTLDVPRRLTRRP